MLTRKQCDRGLFVLAIFLGIGLCFLVPPLVRQYACASQTNDHYLIVYLFCGEMRLTDLALVFFTYCLVVVGAFTLRSNQRTVQDLERAYLWPGFGLLIYKHGERFQIIWHTQYWAHCRHHQNCASRFDFQRGL